MSISEHLSGGQTEIGRPRGRIERVLSVMPGRPEGHNMVFARQAGQALRSGGLHVQEYFVKSRTSPFSLWRDLRQLRSLVAEGRVDALHAQYGAVNGFLCAVAAGFRVPFILSLRGSDINRVPSINRLRNELTRLLSQLAAFRANAVICVSEALRDQLWCNRSKVRVIPEGVDLDVFRPIDKLEARSALQWEPNELVVVFNAGKAPLQKGMPLVNAAIDLLRGDVVSVRLFVTTGTHTREQMAQLFNAADCLVLASETEGSANVVKEAMACNLPVVTVDVGDVRERLQNAHPGAIVERDAKALASGVRSVLECSKRSNGRILLEQQRLGRADTVARLQEVYASLDRICTKYEKSQ